MSIPEELPIFIDNIQKFVSILRKTSEPIALYILELLKNSSNDGLVAKAQLYKIPKNMGNISDSFHLFDLFNNNLIIFLFYH